LLVLLPLAVGAWVAYRCSAASRAWPHVGSVLAAGSVPWTGGEHSPLLPYLLAAGFTLGLEGGPGQLVLALGGTAGGLLVGARLPGATTGDELYVAGAQWVLLALALGLVAMWARHLSSEPLDQYREVRSLLEQLRSLTRNLPGGIDAPTAADALLDRCARVVAHNRSAIVVQPASGPFVPLSVRGATRVPWRAPLDQDGPLRQAWGTGTAVLDVRGGDTAGRRQGSALLAVPLLSSGRPFGLVILESHRLDAFTDPAVTELVALVTAASAQLDTALLFEEVRLEASTEERDRLAREMHDGIAQELASFGYRLDDVRQRASQVDDRLEQAVSELRGDLTVLISDLRLSITGLRTSLRPDRGLGAALSTYLRAVCAGKAVVLNLSLQESSFRLPAEQEVALLKTAQAFAQQVRRSPSVRIFNVQLVVDPPSARLAMSCDAPLDRVDVAAMAATLKTLGAQVTSSQSLTGGPSLDIELKGGPDDDQRPARR
jgi:signal transduction histidine kinase